MIRIPCLIALLNSTAALLAGCVRAHDTQKVTLSVDHEPKHSRYVQMLLAEIIGEPDTGSSRVSPQRALSQLGREDLIHATSQYHRPSPCAPGPAADDPIAHIARLARRHRIVIVNEAHDLSVHRAFTADLARALAGEGFTWFAPLGLFFPPDHEPAPYARDGEGSYTHETMFARMIREAIALGYTPVPYDHVMYSPEEREAWNRMSSPERYALREEVQVENLMERIFTRDPDARVLIATGHGHAAEEAFVPEVLGHEWKPMAARLKERTGLDPLTVDQTSCRGNAKTVRLSARPDNLPPGRYDLHVDHPSAEYVHGRPEWGHARGDIPVSIPAELLPQQGWAVIDAHPAAEPDEAVPMDRVAVRAGETHVKLMLPPGNYRVSVINPKAAE